MDFEYLFCIRNNSYLKRIFHKLLYSGLEVTNTTMISFDYLYMGQWGDEAKVQLMFSNT